ncbi:tripartite tricarboxylate transporter substrate binding protein [Neomoorella mulderi]|uniref:tripartite tricarboxylate transporter substrate binding protein n=1 Tax=Neomoorella mulderi TaxID=202604 RepID=UPI0013735B67|nr:tripartite tricarboxylate transporter substrate binding protein [Moorella mulderi]
MLGLFLALVLAGCGSKSQAPGKEEQKQTSQTAKSEEVKYPTKTIQILCQSAAGSPVDIMARQLAKYAEKYLGQPIVVVQKTGGGTSNQQVAIKEAPADGYTLGTITPSHVGDWNNTLKGKFGIDDYVYITRVQIDPYVVAVNANSQFKTLKDMVDWAKKNPGKLKAGGFGPKGSGHQVAFDMLAQAAGITYTWVPYDGGSAAIAALLGGTNIDVVNTNPGNVMEHVKAGKLRVLGVMNDKRVPALPDVPTYSESGFNVDTSWAQWRGIYAKAGTPKEIVAKLNDAFLKAIKEPEFQKYLNDTNQMDGSMGSEEFTRLVKAVDETTKKYTQ